MMFCNAIELKSQNAKDPSGKIIQENATSERLVQGPSKCIVRERKLRLFLSLGQFKRSTFFKIFEDAEILFKKENFSLELTQEQRNRWRNKCGSLRVNDLHSKRVLVSCCFFFLDVFPLKKSQLSALFQRASEDVAPAIKLASSDGLDRERTDRTYSLHSFNFETRAL